MTRHKLLTFIIGRTSLLLTIGPNKKIVQSKSYTPAVSVANYPIVKLNINLTRLKSSHKIISFRSIKTGFLEKNIIKPFSNANDFQSVV